MVSTIFEVYHAPFHECKSVMHASTCLSHADFSIKQQKSTLNFMHLISNTYTPHTIVHIAQLASLYGENLTKMCFLLVSIEAMRKVKMLCSILKSLLFMHRKPFQPISKWLFAFRRAMQTQIEIHSKHFMFVVRTVAVNI